MNSCMDKQYLEKKYLEEGLSTVAIAKIAQVSPTTVNRWLKSYGIPLRAPKLKGQKLRKPGETQKVRELLASSLEDEKLLDMVEEDVEELINRVERDERAGRD